MSDEKRSIVPEAIVEDSRPLARAPAPVPERAEVDVPEDLREEIEAAMGRYPEKRSASIPALWAVQRRYGWCSPEGIRQAATVMGLTPAYLQSIASFYDLFRLEPQGDHRVLVCTNISCWLRGGDRLLDAFREAASRPRTREGGPSETTGGAGETTGGASETTGGADVLVRGFECLGACDIAPMASIDERYFGPLSSEDATTAVEQLRGGEEVLPERALARRGAAGGSGVPVDERVADHKLNATPGPGAAGGWGRTSR